MKIFGFTIFIIVLLFDKLYDVLSDIGFNVDYYISIYKNISSSYGNYLLLIINLIPVAVLISIFLYKKIEINRRSHDIFSTNHKIIHDGRNAINVIRLSMQNFDGVIEETDKKEIESTVNHLQDRVFSRYLERVPDWTKNIMQGITGDPVSVAIKIINWPEARNQDTHPSVAFVFRDGISRQLRKKYDINPSITTPMITIHDRHQIGCDNFYLSNDVSREDRFTDTEYEDGHYNSIIVVPIRMPTFEAFRDYPVGDDISQKAQAREPKNFIIGYLQIDSAYVEFEPEVTAQAASFVADYLYNFISSFYHITEPYLGNEYPDLANPHQNLLRRQIAIMAERVFGYGT